jgi:hypothetical protein
MTLEAFPGAIPAEEYMKRSAEALGPYGLVPEETLPLVGLCRDELTAELTRLVSNTWGWPFRIGSLGAMLFLGVSGLSAALAHAPAGGGRLRVVVYVMPHVGICSDGRVGAVNRDGQANSTAACGALMRFRGELAEGRVHSGLDQYDLEMSLVRQRLLRAVTYGRVPDVVEITTIARDVILEDLVHTAERVPGWCEADVAVFSGIQIHTRDGDMVAPGRSFLRQAGGDTEVPLEI